MAKRQVQTPMMTHTVLATNDLEAYIKLLKPIEAVCPLSPIKPVNSKVHHFVCAGCADVNQNCHSFLTLDTS